MASEGRKRQMAIGAAVLAGAVAATVAYLFYLKPEWRRSVVNVGRHLLNLAEDRFSRGALEQHKKE